MEIIKLVDRVIYRADIGKKVKFVNSDILYKEIVVKKETDKIVEVSVNE